MPQIRNAGAEMLRGALSNSHRNGMCEMLCSYDITESSCPAGSGSRELRELKQTGCGLFVSFLFFSPF